MNSNNRERVFELLSLYESLLTETQKKALENHYAYDLSFGEISKEQSISRAAANDLVKTAINKMEEYESKLHLLKNKKDLQSILESKDIKTNLDNYIKEHYGI